MRKAISGREEYIKFRLKEWAIWLNSDNNLVGHLKYRCYLGVLIDQHKSQTINIPNEDECNAVNKAFINLKYQHQNEADCIWFAYVEQYHSSRAARKLKINNNTFYERKKAGERFISGNLD